ncbi:putative anthocyanidin 3-O-glucoside 2''-O-glucosyltransferase [Rosa chinensis]|uniref:Glycosyltransferase n=1 Tax=Rosa chinensis TaxID=74649 RepID=A0A2P6Q4H4_ROSCH|nr:cyanidin 3-O-galactoside 2''-O-xylosyltransferase FGGT1 [Rosa chinensis]PRQ29044.1 putative anthocyanidin 3-O-glucoside 2''-O-glucosyltransferase [Rosa chinensis]
MSDDQTLHIAMYPWFAMGHLTAFLHISNKLAERGHKISFFLPLKTQSKLQHYNLRPHLITFIPLNVPHVDGLPPGTETTADIPLSLGSLLATAMDLTRPQIEQSLLKLKPDFVFFDFSYWLPALLRELGNNIKSVGYWVINPASVWYLLSLGLPRKMPFDEADAARSLLCFSSSFSIKLQTHEARAYDAMANKEFGSGLRFGKRILTSFSDCDAICFKTCREFAGPFCNYFEIQMNKPVILAGPVVPDPPSSQLEEKWAKWLGGFEPRTVIFCALGSEYILTKQRLQQLLLGFELTGLPFFAALKPPTRVESIESALPEGFEMRLKGKGVVHGGWVQQPLILKHPSVGCFVTHCGSGSLNEALVNECQLVFLPHVGDHVINARIMSGDLKAGVEVEKGDEDGLFTKESVCKAVKAVMDADSEVGKEVRTNHAKWREFFSNKGLESSYIDGFVQKLHELLR